jgi:AcrR family transcriptional regulator
MCKYHLHLASISSSPNLSHLYFMSSPRNLTRQKIIQAAIELFASQGVSETTTKQIAELAQVNEVTLFRKFGNKHGLLLAVIEDADVFAQLGQSLVTELPAASTLPQMLREYANTCLQALEQTPAAIRSLVGESGQYSIENRQGLGRNFERANRRVAKYLKTNIGEAAADLPLPIDQIVSLLHTLLFGYATIELTSEFHGLWRDRADFLDQVVTLCIASTVTGNTVTGNTVTGNIAQPQAISLVDQTDIPLDLPAPIVDQIFQAAKKHHLQTYALVYVLLGSGLSVRELVSLNRANHLSSSDRQLLQITQGLIRQVPINQWIMGKRYGSYLKNPLTQWLKSRKDDCPALFLGLNGNPLAEADLRQQWQELTSGIITLTGLPPELEQLPATWCVEMLTRGLTIEAMQVLTGWEASRLAPYVRRAQAQIVLSQSIELDMATR